MNASFRTAFWALCLGLTVPMVLFVGVELTSGGNASRQVPLSAYEHRGSLRGYWQNADPKLAIRAPLDDVATSRSNSHVEPKPKSSVSPPIVAQTPTRTPSKRDDAAESSDSNVVLGPQLELDPVTAEPTPARDRRVPAMVTGIGPSIEILPDPGEKPRDNPALETRLASIQLHLERLDEAIAAQVRREPPVDPIKQAAELLRELRHARELEEPVAQVPAPSESESEDDKPEPVRKKSEPPQREPEPPIEVPRAAPETTPKKPRTVSKIYRPRFLSGTALQALVEPLLTEGVGKAGAADAASDGPVPTGGKDGSPGPASALVVRDLPEVLRKIDRLLIDLDVPPLPVMIEATVVTVRLNNGMPQGIDLQEFNTPGQSFAVMPAEGRPSGPSTAPFYRRSGLSPGVEAPLLTHGFGLKTGVLQGDPRAFVSVLQTAAQARRVGAWQINVLDRQSAQLMLNDPFGPEGSVAQSSAGTILNIRPVVTQKGSVLLDVQRAVELDAPASGSRSAALTSQIALSEGQTAILGGLYAEHLAAHSYRTPVLGQIPLVGRLFRKQSGVVERSETIVLLTPHVSYPPAVSDEQTVRKDRPRSKPLGRPILKEVAVPRVRKSPAQALAAGPAQPKQKKPVAPATTESVKAKRAPTRLYRDRIVQTGGEQSSPESGEPSLDSIPVLELSAEPEPGPLITPARRPLSKP
jgi:type IV pilus assembly protein PilQ